MEKDVVRVSVVSESEFTVQGHGVHTAYVELTNALRKYTDADVVVNTSGPADITHFHTVGFYALRRLLFDRSRKIVSAHIVPASLVGSLVGARFWLPLARVYLRWFYNKADVVFAVSDETRRELEKLGVKKPIEVTYNLIDTERYHTTLQDKVDAREALNMSEDTWVVMGAGQVQPRKRVDAFIAAARQLPDVNFVWVGGMPFGKLAAEHGAMQRMLDNAPRNFTCTGTIKLEEVKQYYQAADAFWLPSEQETFGLVVVEAAAAGLPVVLRDIPDYDETFRKGATMVTDQTVVEALKRLRFNEGSYRNAQRLSDKCIAKRFDAKAGAARVSEIYHELLAS